ncbi:MULTISPECIES: hypothetical protein [Metabacillus]|uniref:Uncharacterized protein n=1 Tax=Metabacillus rhizolycopersici TaxID=2875709 RepID=A0ABS7UYY2_9BACI|nr:MULTISPECIES: hypothetical protein [Metabacillus]MBZ5753341.1 hypothetical protein [Metabacillus rhizolycopersici]MCM3654347.1 hypothetical protein [Metabacillus litoralis]
MPVLDRTKPLRSINIKSEYNHLKTLPIVENKEKRNAILNESLKTLARIKVR